MFFLALKLSFDGVQKLKFAKTLFLYMSLKQRSRKKLSENMGPPFRDLNQMHALRKVTKAYVPGDNVPSRPKKMLIRYPAEGGTTRERRRINTGAFSFHQQQALGRGEVVRGTAQQLFKNLGVPARGLGTKRQAKRTRQSKQK